MLPQFSSHETSEKKLNVCLLREKLNGGGCGYFWPSDTTIDLVTHFCRPVYSVVSLPASSEILFGAPDSEESPQHWMNSWRTFSTYSLSNKSLSDSFPMKQILIFWPERPQKLWDTDKPLNGFENDSNSTGLRRTAPHAIKLTVTSLWSGNFPDHFLSIWETLNFWYLRNTMRSPNCRKFCRLTPFFENLLSQSAELNTERLLLQMELGISDELDVVVPR